MKQVSAYYTILNDEPKTEVFMDFFLEGETLSVKAQLFDQSISSKKPIWGFDKLVKFDGDRTNDDIIFYGQRSIKLSRREVSEMVSKLRLEVLDRIERDIFK